MQRKDYSTYSRNDLIKIIKEYERTKFGLIWEEKLEDVSIQCDKELPVLVEDKDREIVIDRNHPTNILIEGDNYHALWVLNYTHKKAIDLIYIDPPYNTGKEDFTFNDKIVDEEDTYRHSKWLSFMSKRLRLAKNLLKNDGIIFISIDDNEQAHLKLLCDKIFGEKNFIQNIIWRKRSGPPNDKDIGAVHEYILCYSRKLSSLKLNRKERSEKQILRYANPDNHPKGSWAPDNLMANVKGGRYVESLYFPIINPITKEKHWPSSHGNWRFNNDRINELIANNEIYFGKDGKGRPKLKRFYCDVREGVPFSTIWDYLPHNNAASKEIHDILGNLNLFDTPKPVDLIIEILNLASRNDTIVLDFFAGSGTTGHAVLKYNKLNNKKIKFILCTDNYNNICEKVCYPRVSRVIKGFKKIKKHSGNLKYYKTDFVPTIKTDNDKRKLVERSTEMLCLAESTFDKLIFKYNKFGIFENKDTITGILYDEDYLEEFKLILKKYKKQLVIYVFSYDQYYNEEDFDDVDNVLKIKPIPEVILNVYRNIAKIKKR